MNKQFNNNKSCYYELYAVDKVDISDLDPYNRKYLQIYVEKMQSMTGYIGSTSSDVLSLSQTAINQFNYNFTVPYSDTFYLVLQP